MRDHVACVARTAQTCSYHLRRLRAVPRQLGRDVTAWVVSAFVLSRLDYCNVVLTGLPASTLAPLRRVLHAATCLILDLRLCPRDHVTQALQELHWLLIAQRIDYKLCLSRTGRAPVYMSDMLTPAADVTLRAMHSSTNCDYFVYRTTLRFRDRAFSVAAPEPGIGCHQNWRLEHR